MPTLNKFKIHPPLPLNPRESKQLLNLLTASFRQQLDAEHGEFRTSHGIKPSTGHKSPETSKQRRRSHSESDSRPTDKHMRSILTNPLFNLTPDEKNPKADRDPMEVFDLAVAKGMMNLHYARACLNAKKRDIIQSPILSVREGLKESGAGLKVLKWLISSGTANNNEFLKDGPFAYVLMEYLVAEGLQEICWKWIKRAFEGIPQYLTIRDPLQHKVARRDIVGPLYLLVRAEASETVSLDAAYLCMSRAVGYMMDCPIGRMRDLLSPPGWFLLAQTTELHSERPPPSPSAFESFFSLVPVLSKDSAYQLAHLSLFHPSEPKVDLALAFLRNLSLSSSVRHIKDYSYINMSLETAKFLLDRERYEDAEWVMNFLRERYPKQLGIRQRGQLEQAKAEASSLQLLESLSLV
jgi:hypothetical protein